MKQKIFISHKKEDTKKAEELAIYIKEEHNLEAYVDTLDDNINSTNDITDRIVNKLRDSSHMLVIFSEHTQESMWVPFELGVSYEREQGIGVCIWPDADDSISLPEYLDSFPKLKENEDLIKYLDEVKKYPSYDLEEISLEESKLTVENSLRSSNYAREFIDNLKKKL
ncbi:toll/interleukin-1 receptor domain-containing protein [Halarcobacter sp.]|uniref:toll/interleukin-1 receptor domain-containing protein n=1 Tax=Halarcobacter sp. TaxID=2321133 RepID=UPI003A948EBE